jgi:hypothetical protein
MPSLRRKTPFIPTGVIPMDSTAHLAHVIMTTQNGYQDGWSNPVGFLGINELRRNALFVSLLRFFTSCYILPTVAENKPFAVELINELTNGSRVEFSFWKLDFNSRCEKAATSEK